MRQACFYPMKAIQKTNECSFLFKTFFFFSLLFSALQGYSQQPNFSGNWTLQQRISISGNDYANGIPNEIDFSKNGEFVRISFINDGYDTIVLNLNINGQPTKTTSLAKKDRISTIKWLGDNKNFAQVNDYISPGKNESDQKNTTTWTLTDEGAILTIIKVSENYINGETWSMKGIYKRKE
jgi:hypothetical protein